MTRNFINSLRAVSLIVSACGITADIEPQSLAILRAFTDFGEFAVAVVESDSRGADRRLVINCVARCDRSSSYEERAIGLPLGIVRASDIHPVVLVTWGGGVGYSITGYELRPEGARKVLDLFSRSFPDVSTEDQQILITTSNYAYPGAGMDRQLRYQLRKWDGREFLIVDR